MVPTMLLLEKQQRRAELVLSYDWHDFYRGTQEPIPGDAPEPRGNAVSTHCFVDADHAGNRVTRRS